MFTTTKTINGFGLFFVSDDENHYRYSPINGGINFFIAVDKINYANFLMLNHGNDYYELTVEENDEKLLAELAEFLSRPENKTSKLVNIKNYAA